MSRSIHGSFGKLSLWDCLENCVKDLIQVKAGAYMRIQSPLQQSHSPLLNTCTTCTTNNANEKLDMLSTVLECDLT